MTADVPSGRDQLGEATVPCGRDGPALARSLVSRWLAGHGDAALHADARLLVSELVTNSLLHAGQPDGVPLHVSAAALNSHVRVAVEDHGHGPVRRRAPDPHHGGFGLHLVELISARWGVDHERGTKVWFELATRGRPT
jgi:anti-sigma regulatory factor (Ser/Thr protein kinase)